MRIRDPAMFAFAALLIAAVGFAQSWNVALAILNMCLVSAIVALGVNLQWGYAGLFNFGIVGFVALGGVATVLVSAPPVEDAWRAGGSGLAFAALIGLATFVCAGIAFFKLRRGRVRALGTAAILLIGLFLYRSSFDPAVEAIESIEPARFGFLGGFGLPVLVAWPVGALLAAGAAYLIGKVALGLRTDYLAIATLSIAEIIIAVIKNEDWLTRGVKNVIGLPRPVPYEIDLQNSDEFVSAANSIGLDSATASSLFVKISYGGLFLVVLLALYALSQLALNSPWGRMMRAIRDDENAAEALGKDVSGRHLQVFVIGSAICGLAGAMMTTLEGQLTPGQYNPLRFTFLAWVMVIVGGAGNNRGAILGGILVWFFWIEVEYIGAILADSLTFWLGEGSALRKHVMESVAYMRLPTMGLILLLMLRFYPRGLIPEK
ncbi:MAG: branched-chain amino acid ABC transporter permease [Albidovulum sp.]|nr:branched-chain amino acid ABC transporter permease [Albidovulum sp.]